MSFPAWSLPPQSYTLVQCPWEGAVECSTSPGLSAMTTNLVLQSKHHPASSPLLCLREDTVAAPRESQQIKHQTPMGKFTLAKLQQLAAPRPSPLPSKILLELLRQLEERHVNNLQLMHLDAHAGGVFPRKDQASLLPENSLCCMR